MALVVLAGSAEVIKIAAVVALGKSTEVSEVQKGLALDPDNPALHDRLSQLFGDSLGLPNLAESVRQARRATVLNPNKSDYWLNLASACESVHDNACADQAVQRALVLSPVVPLVWWEAGNYYLRADQPKAAFPCFHHLLDLSPDYAAPTFDLTLHTYGDSMMILENIVGEGKDPRLALAFADFMSAKNDFDAAHQAWTRIASGVRRSLLWPYSPTLSAYWVTGVTRRLRRFGCTSSGGVSSPSLRTASRAIWCSTAALNNRP